MRWRVVIILFAIVLALFWWWASRPVGDQSAAVRHDNTPAVPTITTTKQAVVAITKDGGGDTNARPWIEKLSDFATKGNLYNYNPELVGWRQETNRVGWWVNLQTKSHNAEFYNGKLIVVASLYDGSDERRRPEVMDEWYRCTARWSEKEAVETTIAILRNLGDTGRLAEALKAPVEYRAPTLQLKAPDGTTVEATPFPKVSIGDLVSAEYRMGSTGVLGLVRWFNNR